MTHTTLNEHYRRQFGCKVYKLALEGGMTCPNRDGTLGHRGCIFCSAGGSGEFAASRTLSVAEQIAQAKGRIAAKTDCKKFIAYFQPFTSFVISATSTERTGSVFIFFAISSQDASMVEWSRLNIFPMLG